MQDIESDTGYDTRRRASDGALAHLSQTTVYDTCGSVTPASRRRTAPSRWTCSATRYGPRASTPATFYHDFASGVRDDRPGLDSCVRALRTGDVLVVWKLDRLGRTLAHLVNTVQDLSTRGVGLRVLTEQGAQIDTTTAAGRLVFGIFAALAEFERELIRERTLAGLTAARADARAAERSRCRKRRCDWPRPPWRTATRPCPHSAANSGSPP